ncbi:hypothetical protein LSH36_186g02014 [Paralvinella palmiformis]|uniref:Breast cancer metastasis-suppressor 1-like protein n=1 Tax=Paralvinella palmiformis TaxID=53620 RepID=A0AAD9N871_9ANNE|nr:hypothetical protein LSH36_186g02014 [Paralvinella palmiformis]
MPGINDKNFTEEEDMDQDTPESANSEDDDSELGTDSEGDDSSELDDGDAEQRREEYMFDMSDLERQFIELKEQLYIERIAQIDAKLAEVKTGRAPEYLNPLAQLQESMRIRTQVAGILRELKQQNITNKYEAEKQAAEQNYESEKNLLFDQVRSDLREKIRRLEEDRHNIDITSDLWTESHSGKKKRKSDLSASDRRRKPVTVTDIL